MRKVVGILSHSVNMPHLTRIKASFPVGINLALRHSVSFEAWCAIASVLFLFVALIPNRLERLPLTTAAIYLGIGLLLSPLGFGVISLSPLKESHLLLILTETAVVISLFSAGLKLRLPFTDKRWLISLRLAFLSMTITVGLITLIGVTLLHLPLGAAVLLGGILAPTDPVLAADVQVKNPSDEDKLRVALTGEAGFNDGTAFPFILLGLGLLGHHDLGAWGWKWFAIDILWETVAGISVGALLGILVGRRVLWLRREHNEAVGTDDFIALGLMAGAYGITSLMHANGFLGVFAAGLALRHIERHLSNRESHKAEHGTTKVEAVEEENNAPEKRFPPPKNEADVERLREVMATHPFYGPRHFARQVLRFDEALERAAELALVVLVGGMMTQATWTNSVWWLAPLLFLGVRPLATWLGLQGCNQSRIIHPYVAWFGLRGLGSLFYIFYAIDHGLPEDLARQMLPIVFSVVCASVVLHGVTVTPLMNHYEKTAEAQVPSSNTQSD